jgi:hypothetical protein
MLLMAVSCVSFHPVPPTWVMRSCALWRLFLLMHVICLAILASGV